MPERRKAEDTAPRVLGGMPDAGWAAFVHDWRAQFLEGVADGLTVSQAAHRAGVAKGTAAQIAARDRGFAQAWEHAEDVAQRWRLREADHALWARHVEGVQKPIFYQGEQRGAVCEFDTTAGKAWLAAHDPRYRSNPPVDAGSMTVILNISGHTDDTGAQELMVPGATGPPAAHPNDNAFPLAGPVQAPLPSNG